MTFDSFGPRGACGRVASAAIVAALCLPTAAFAQVRVVGEDHYLGTGGAESIDLVMVKGGSEDLGKTVFCRVTANGKVVADRLAYTISAEDLDGDNEYDGILGTVGDSMIAGATYTVEVFDNRDEKGEPLYSGQVTPVYAQLEGLAGLDVLGYQTRSAQELDRRFNAPRTVAHGSDTFVLASEDPVSTSPLTYAYELENADAEKVSGSITYVDGDGNVLLVDEIEGITKGESIVADVRQLVPVERDGAVTHWRSIYHNATVAAAYPGARDFVVVCTQLPASVVKSRGFHVAHINYRDEDGNLLERDTVTVAGVVEYTLPSMFYKGGATGAHVQEYALAPTTKQALSLGEKNVLALQPTKDGVAEDGTKEYDVYYTSSEKTGEFDWAVIAVNGTADPNGSDRVISGLSKTIKVREGEGAAVYEVKPEVQIDGVTYVPAEGTPASYTYAYGDVADVPQYVYYVPKDCETPEDYAVTVNYVDFVSGEVLKSESHTVSASSPDYYSFETEASFVRGAITYERLDGQDAPLKHGYYTPVHTYTVYYHDASQPLTHGEAIHRVRVVYTDGGVVYVPGVTRYVDGEMTDGGVSYSRQATKADLSGGSSKTSISAEGGASSIDSDDGATLVGNDGKDLNAERIDGGETPLDGLETAKEAGLSGRVGALAGIAAAAIAAFAWLFLRRGRNGDSDGAQDAE